MTKKADLFNKITLIIPTHNRHQYLSRVLDYYNDINLRILVADSSQKEYPFKNGYEIDYFHYPNYLPQNKLADIIQKVKTPYVFLCADDDFIMPKAIEKCIEFLEKNNDYGSVQGKYVRFYNKSRNISFEPFYTTYKDYHFDAKSPIERMKQLLSTYIPVFYSIQMTKNLHQGLSFKDLSNGYLNEIYLALMTVINGKHKVLPFYYGVREKTKYGKRRNYESLESFIKNPNNKEEYELFLNYVSKYISENYDYTFNDSKKYVQEAIDSYLNIFLPFYKKKKIWKPTYKTSEKIQNIFYSMLKVISPKLYNFIKNKTIYGDFENPSSKYYADFKQIRKLISNHSRRIRVFNNNPKPILYKANQLPVFNKFFQWIFKKKSS